MKTLNLAFLPVLVALLVSSGCASLGKKGGMQRAPLAVGYTLYRVAPGSDEEESWTVTAVSDTGDVTAKNSDGCIWQVTSEWVPPNISWKDCGSNPKWNSGSRSITDATGTIWPLKVGNKASYAHEYEFTSGVTGSGVRDCEVVSFGPIAVPMGEYDAYVVECKDQYSKHFELTRTYFAPGVGEVKYMREHSEKGVIREVEATRIEL